MNKRCLTKSYNTFQNLLILFKTTCHQIQTYVKAFAYLVFKQIFNFDKDFRIQVTDKPDPVSCKAVYQDTGYNIISKFRKLHSFTQLKNHSKN